MSNGQPLIVRGALKPISTMRTPLQTVDVKTLQRTQAHFERSDVCVVPAAGVIGESHGGAGAGRRAARKIRRR